LGSAYAMRTPVPDPVPKGRQETKEPQVISPSSSEKQVDIPSQPMIRTQDAANSSAFTLTSFEMSDMNGCNDSVFGNDGDQGILNQIIVTPRRKSKTVKDFQNTPSFALALEVIGMTIRVNDVPMDETTKNQLFDLITASSPNQGEYLKVTCLENQRHLKGILRERCDGARQFWREDTRVVFEHPSLLLLWSSAH
jgi:hypothetical protein